LDPLETARHIETYAGKWNPRKIFVEDVGAQSMFVARIKADTLLPIYPIGSESKDKLSRIDTLASPIEQGRILFHRSQQDLINEFLNLPGGSHDDLPDALEMACRDILRRGNQRGLPHPEKDSRDWREGVGENKREMPFREL
jgi:phage terminase large subunit-like protein